MSKKGNHSGQSRINRINDEIKKEISKLINYEVKDPRLEAFITVVSVDTTNDLYYCKIYISVFGDENTQKQVLEGLKSAKGFIRRELARRINLRKTPELTFVIDDTLEQAMKIDNIINKISKEYKNDAETETESEIDDLED
ncbi:MAG: 30S ribosome-binding factor RbfA [Lachnospirales bacterium]